MRIGISKASLTVIKETTTENGERLELVWNRWFNETERIRKEYPPTWEGLRRLLEDCGMKEIAAKYFALRDSHFSD